MKKSLLHLIMYLFIIITFLLANRPVSADEADWNEFVEATRCGDVATMQELIAVGVDINHADEVGWTALHWWNFCDELHMDTLKFLFEHGININAIDSRGRTALMLFLYYGDDQPPGPNLEAIQLFIDAGTDLTIRDEWGETAFILGLNSRYPEVRSFFKRLREETSGQIFIPDD